MRMSGAKRLVATIERTPLAWPMALLMAGAAAFLTYAMPAAIVEPLVAMPFGAAARSGLMLAVAIVSGGAVWWLFDRLEGGRADAEDEADPDIDLFAPETPAPQLRRADAHPDAPPRRPIFAASDLGAPLAEAEQAQTPFGRAPLFTDAPDDEPEMLLLDERFGLADDMVAADPEPAPRPMPAPVMSDSIAGLMARLERGLERRDVPAIAPGDPDGGLRQALDELRRMTIGR